jgi:hypothetical protein
MKSSILELLPELVELLVFGVGATGLTLVGGYIERFALLTVQSGEVALGLWAVVMGAVCFAFAYFLTMDRVVPTLSALRRADR